MSYIPNPDRNIIQRYGKSATAEMKVEFVLKGSKPLTAKEIGAAIEIELHETLKPNTINMGINYLLEQNKLITIRNKNEFSKYQLK